MGAEEYRIKKGLVVYSKASGSTILDIQGVSGQMFSVVDNLEGLIHHVSDISGIPIFEVYSDNVLKLGLHSSPALVVSGSTVHNTPMNTTITTPTTSSLDMGTSNNVNRYLLESNLTINFTTDPISTDATTYIFIFKQDGTGGKTVSWNTTGTTVVWEGGTEPVISSTADTVTVVTIIWTGQEYLGKKTFN